MMADLRTRAAIALRNSWADRLGVVGAGTWDDCDDTSKSHWLNQVDTVLGQLPPSLRDITFERSTHEQRGWTAEHDAEHGVGHLVSLSRRCTDYPAGITRDQLVKAAS